MCRTFYIITFLNSTVILKIGIFQTIPNAVEFTLVMLQYNVVTLKYVCCCVLVLLHGRQVVLSVDIRFPSVGLNINI